MSYSSQKGAGSLGTLTHFLQLSNKSRDEEVIPSSSVVYGELPNKVAILNIIIKGVHSDTDLATLLLESVERHYQTTGIPICGLRVVYGNGLWKILEWKEGDTMVKGI